MSTVVYFVPLLSVVRRQFIQLAPSVSRQAGVKRKKGRMTSEIWTSMAKKSICTKLGHG